MKAKRTGIILRPDRSRVFCRPFIPNSTRLLKIVARVMTMSEQEVAKEARRVIRAFGEGHVALKSFFRKRFEDASHAVFVDTPLSETRQELIGAYLTQEYSLESTALFNPSMVRHPDQSNLPDGSIRFIQSLRATGEGHLSSIVFRSGIIDADGGIMVNPAKPFVISAEVDPNRTYDRSLFERKLLELGLLDGFAKIVLTELSEEFDMSQLEASVRLALRRDRANRAAHAHTGEGMLSLARSNYEITFTDSSDISERVIFPMTEAENKGIEDARFVEFRDDDGQTIYYATYTAFDGDVILPQLLETRNFMTFKISTLNGPEVANKGMALFPRKINGHYAMISRQDNENMYLMYSDMLHFWYTKQILLRPTYPWEFVQIGNCGSPIETDRGWLVITHGVGPMREYSIGAVLLDLDDPSKVIGRLEKPLLSPIENERDGYVPNVVYSCGALVHAGRLILPYAMSDHSSSFATVSIDELLGALLGGA